MKPDGPDDTSPTPTDDHGWFALPVRRPVHTLAAALAVVVLAAMLIRTMPTDGSLAALLPAHDSSSAALAAIGEDFSAAEQATLLVSLPEQPCDGGMNGDDMAAFAQRFERSLMDDAESHRLIRAVTHRWPDDAEPFVRDVVAPNLVLYLDERGQAELRHRLSPSGMAEQMRMNEQAAAAPGVAGSSLAPLLQDPLRLRELVQGVFADLSTNPGRPGSPMLSADRRSLMIQVTPAASTTQGSDAGATMALIRRAIDDAGPGDLDVSVTGGVAIADAAERSIRGDMIASSIGTVILLQLLFLATYRRLLLFPLAFLPAAAGVVVGFGVFALTGRAISPPTAVLGALLAGLGIDYAIHYLAHAHEHPALAHNSRRLAPPLVMAAVTSVIAFGTVGLSDVTALRDFALIGAVGLSATLLATLTLLPALLTLMRRRRSSIQSDPQAMVDQPRWRLDRLLHTTIQYRKACLAACCIGVLAGVAVLALTPDGPVRFDSDLNAMHPQPNPPLDTQQRLARAFPGQADALLLYITAGNEAQLLERAATSSQQLRQAQAVQPYLASVVSIDRLLPSPAERESRRDFAATFDAARVLADFDAAVEQSAFNPEAFADYRVYLSSLLNPGSGPDLATLRRYPAFADALLPSDMQAGRDEPLQAISIVSLTHPLDDRYDRDAAISAMRASLGDVPGITLTGMPVVGHDIERAVKRDLSRLLVIASVVVTLWLLLCFRSLRDTASALLPVTSGLVVLFAIMLLTGTGLNLINLIALPLLAGLGVDDGVFLVSIARDARRRGLDRAGLITALASSAQAVTLTSATTALAFGSLVLTGVPAIRSLGIVMAVGIGACLLLSLVALAPLLVMLHPDHPTRAVKGATA